MSDNLSNELRAYGVKLGDTPRTASQVFNATTEKPSCGHYELEVVYSDFARELERENTKLREALKRARDWGIQSNGFCSHECAKLAAWVDAGMTGPLPELAEHLKS